MSESADYRQIQRELCKWAETVRDFNVPEIPRLDRYDKEVRARVVLDLINAGWFKATLVGRKTHRWSPDGRTREMIATI